MAHHHTSILDLPEGGEHLSKEKTAVLSTILLGVGVIGTVISLGILFFGGEWSGPFAYSWLFGFYFFLSICVGGLFWTLLHNAANAGWGVSVRRVWENLSNVLPLFALLAIPFLFPKVHNALYEWMAIHHEAGGKEGLGKFAEGALLKSKYGYLNLTFWYIRMVLYFVVLGFTAWRLRKFFLDQEKDGKFSHTFKARAFACSTLALFAVAATFLSIDLLMALDFRWYSTMWGVYIFAGSAWAAMAVCILTINWLRSQGLMLKVVSEEHYHLMGKLLFAFSVFWAYIAFSQYFLIWYANITEETMFFHLRNTEGWHVLSLVLLFGHFLIPFLCLLHVWVKKNPRLMNIICVWVLVMHMVDYYWIIIPERGPSLTRELGDNIQLMIPHAFWGDILAFVSIGCLSTWLFIRQMGSHTLYAWRDPRLEESVNAHN
jgi:hypothetical protein